MKQKLQDLISSKVSSVSNWGSPTFHKEHHINHPDFECILKTAAKLEARLEAAELYAMATNGYCECHRYQPSANQSCDSCMLQQKLYEDWQKLVNEVE